jgi:hypothetical protein
MGGWRRSPGVFDQFLSFVVKPLCRANSLPGTFHRIDVCSSIPQLWHGGGSNNFIGLQRRLLQGHRWRDTDPGDDHPQYHGLRNGLWDHSVAAGEWSAEHFDWIRLSLPWMYLQLLDHDRLGP